MAFFALKTKMNELAGKPARLIPWIILAVLIVAAGCFFWHYVKVEPIEAEGAVKKWKNFSEDRFGFKMAYPADWNIGRDYDRYADGMLDIDLNNKKNGRRAECGSRYIDLRIFIGDKPEAEAENSGSDLKSQLFREIEMIKNSGNADLVESLDIEGKSAFKIKSDAPTLSLNGRCPGPLYLLDTDSMFVYIFAGTGNEARDLGEKMVEQIISSIKVD
jgi:hypothetical protein